MMICFLSLPATGKSHTVAKGETLYSISRTYGMTVAELCNANNIKQNEILREGQVLTIPDTVSGSEVEEYTVVKGDTFYGIARAYGIPVDELLALNKLSASDTLKIGQLLKVPAKLSGETADSLGPLFPDVHIELTDPRIYSGKTGDSSLQWPVKNPEVVYVEGKISGVQLSAQRNESVTVVRAGTVMFSGVYRGFGKVVFVQAQNGLMYVYTGLNEIYVKKSDYVAFGDTLGTVGTDVLTGKPQMIFMVFQNGKPIDPAIAPRG